MQSLEPSPTETNGRSLTGQFGHGNSFATGNPHASRVQKLRTAMLSAITEDDIQEIVTKLIAMALNGDTKAAALLFSQLGKPVETTVVQAEPVDDVDARRDQIRAVAEQIRARRLLVVTG